MSGYNISFVPNTLLIFVFFIVYLSPCWNSLLVPGQVSNFLTNDALKVNLGSKKKDDVDFFKILVLYKKMPKNKNFI